MQEITIKRANLADLAQMQAIGKQTFIETFAESNSAEDLEKYLQESFSTERLKSELENPDSAFYFAMSGEEAIGYLKLNFGSAQTEPLGDDTVEIQRIYVLQAFHGKKVGQILYDVALDFALQRKAAYIWLGVWEKNPRAIKFYQKNGFVEFDKHVFVLGDDEQTDILMKRLL